MNKANIRLFHHDDVLDIEEAQDKDAFSDI